MPSLYKELRESFYKNKCRHYEGRHEVYENNPEDIADFFIGKLDFLLKEKILEIRRLDNEYEEGEDADYWKGRSDAIEEVITILNKDSNKQSE